MTESKIRRQGSLDHRHRHRLLARRRAGCALGCAERKEDQRRRQAVCALHRASAGAGDLRRPDPEKGRPAPDGSLAAHRHLCRGAGAGFGRHQRQQGNSRADGHDRRRRRRRARPCGRPRDHDRRCQGQFEPRLSQRTADERSAADAVSGAALQPARRQHRHRPWRVRNVAHLHGRGSRLDRRGADRAGAHRVRAERDRAGRRRP